MRIKDITTYLESLAPSSTQESYDNSGLIVGDPQKEVTGALISLDCTEEVVEEAIQKGVNLIISHHPIVFRGLKRFNGSNYVERTVIKAIRNDISLYAIHTNLDHYIHGVNREIVNRLNLENVQVLQPSKEQLIKLITYVPTAHKENVLNALFEAGAGHVGNYSECSFGSEGEGTFRGNEESQPFVGEKNQRHAEKEIRIETILPKFAKGRVLKALFTAHPYEEVAYDLVPLLNDWSEVGSGMIGELALPMEEMEFLQKVKSTFNCGAIRYTQLKNKPVKKVAVCGGAGGFLQNAAKAKGADIFITADYKYHEFFDAEGEIVIADIGHYESEQFTTNLLADIITKKFPKFALHLTGINTNPIKYL
ncbi:MAG: Nif3-like dinuclear metal center hexameric protein [Crocinitomicaceae bacterium]|jgi:dinuclear metal center YbgI/SA1388 family protein|nr:Nif3-like dinuclear metal center hexameric protein [Crocinitomicaceae bacterium]